MCSQLHPLGIRPFELGIHFGVRRCWEKFPCETIFG